MLTFIFLAFVAYLLFRLIFNFIIPIYQTTKRVKRSFREMHEKMQAQTNGSSPHESTPENHTQKKTMGDYIDFEEVKD